MSTTNRKKFKGEIENYLNNGLHNFESKIDGAFSALKVQNLVVQIQYSQKGRLSRLSSFIHIGYPTVVKGENRS